MSEVKGIDVEGTELVNVQVGGTLFRDGGPYGDQSDAIRDEKVNAAREGREPNFDALIPMQYKLAPKEEVKQIPAVVSQATNFEDETIYLSKSAPYEKNVRSSKAKTVDLSNSEDSEQADSENVAKGALVDPNPAPKSESEEDIFEGK